MFFGTFVGQSNVLRLIEVFTVTDLPIHTFLLHVYVRQNLCNLLCIYIYYIILDIHIFYKITAFLSFTFYFQYFSENRSPSLGRSYYGSL